MPPIHQYRVTKFDPARRNAAGHYTANDWYLHSQIGDTFDGNQLTEEEYLRVESAYIAAAARFHANAGQPDIFTIGAEDNRNLGAPAEGSLITSDQLPELCRTMLREECWCRIEGCDFFIHFGYDFYMYLGSAIPCGEMLNFVRSLGLFLEPFVSPYHPEDD